MAAPEEGGPGYDSEPARELPRTDGGIRPGRTAMPLRGVIFDLDGTLVDTNWYHVEAWRRAFAAGGYDVPAERIAAEVGKGGDQLIPAVLGQNAADRDGDAVRKGYTQEFRTIAGRERFAVFPRAVELLDALHRRGLKTALATSSPQDL